MFCSVRSDSEFFPLVWANTTHDHYYLLVPDWATRNSNTRRVLTLKTQTQLNSSTKKPEKFLLLKPKLKILEQNSSLMHVWTRQFETRWNSNSIKSELDLALEICRIVWYRDVHMYVSRSQSITYDISPTYIETFSSLFLNMTIEILCRVVILVAWVLKEDGDITLHKTEFE